MLQKNKEEETFKEALLGCAVGFASWVFFGLCLSLMWNWFVVPLGAASIGIAHAMGLAALVHFVNERRLQYKTITENDPTAKSWMISLALMVGALGILGVGWVLQVIAF